LIAGQHRVRTDDGDAAQGFDGGQAPNDGSFARHAQYAQRENERRDGRQSYRYRRDREADADFDHHLR
jgi:hypothetical protein